MGYTESEGMETLDTPQRLRPHTSPAIGAAVLWMGKTPSAPKKMFDCFVMSHSHIQAGVRDLSVDMGPTPFMPM